MALGIMTTSTKTLTTLVGAALAIEKLRVASEVRQTHLTRQGRQDPETAEVTVNGIPRKPSILGMVETVTGEAPLLL